MKMQTFYVDRKNGMLHQLPAGLKLLLVGILLLSLIFSSNFIVLLVNSMILLASSFLFGGLTLFKRLKPFLFLIVLIVVFHSVLNPANATQIYSIFYMEGFMYGLSISIRLMTILVVMHLYLFTTHPQEIFELFYRWHPSLGMIMMLLLGLLPVMKREMEWTRIAQEVRGLSWGGYKGKLKAYVMIVIPVIIKSLYRAQSMADLLYLRGFQGEKKKEKRALW